MSYLEDLERCLNDIDLAIADCFLLDLTPGHRREIEALATFYSLIRSRFNAMSSSGNNQKSGY